MISNKYYITLFLLLITSLSSFAQVKIGNDVSTIHDSSLLELESATKVLVLTRVRNSEMLGITPLDGALVYNTDTKCVYSFNGVLWQNLCDSTSNVISIIDNEDGSFTLSSTDGSTFTSPDAASLKGEVGATGATGATGTNGLSAFQIATNNGFSGTEAQWLVSLEGTDGNDGNNGTNGLSAFQIATNNGFSGTEAQWLTSLEGADGSNGDDGAAGSNGLSAYQVATNNGFTGTEAEWLTSLEGEDGNDGATGTAGSNGQSAYEIAQNNGFAGTEAEWLESLEGADGNDGATGTAGSNGQSAYEIAQNNGFAGTEAEWLASLQGADGNDGDTGAAGSNGQSAYEIAQNNGFAGTEAEWLESLEGADGNDGDTGAAGSNGQSAYQIAQNNGFAGTEAEWLESLEGADGATAIKQNLDSPDTITTLSTSALTSYLKTEILTQASAFSTSDLTGASAVDLSIVACPFTPVESNIVGAKYVGEIQWEILETVAIFKNRFAIYVNGTRVTPVLNIWPNVVNITSAPTSRFFEYTSTGSDVIELRMSRAVGATGVSHVLNAQLKLRRSF